MPPQSPLAASPTGTVSPPGRSIWTLGTWGKALGKCRPRVDGRKPGTRTLLMRPSMRSARRPWLALPPPRGPGWPRRGRRADDDRHRRGVPSVTAAGAPGRSVGRSRLPVAPEAVGGLGHHLGGQGVRVAVAEPLDDHSRPAGEQRPRRQRGRRPAGQRPQAAGPGPDAELELAGDRVLEAVHRRRAYADRVHSGPADDAATGAVPGGAAGAWGGGAG